MAIHAPALAVSPQWLATASDDELEIALAAFEAQSMFARSRGVRERAAATVEAIQAELVERQLSFATTGQEIAR